MQTTSSTNASGDAGSSADVEKLNDQVTTSFAPDTPNPPPTPTRVPRVGYVYDPRMMAHAQVSEVNEDGSTNENDHDHPEQPRRIERIHEKLEEGGCVNQMARLAIRLMRKDEALLVHTEEHWHKVAAIEYMTPEHIQNSKTYYEQLSLYVHPKTPEAALLSAGGVIEACLAVANGKVRTAFANVRPPGHHAEPEEHMGFCFFNNVAIAARVVQLEAPVKRILILDWDVHHGNGTQRAFYSDPSVLYISLHRYEGGEFYPSGTFGSMESCGEGEGIGKSVNIPWPIKGMRDADYLYAFIKIVMPIAYEFAPELVIISAGFDAAEGDTLGECHVSPSGYAHMTHMLSSLANGKVVVALEGGYNLDSISASSLAVADVLLGNPPPMIPELTASEAATETVWQVARVQSRYWKCMDPKAVEPKEELVEEAISVPDLLKAYRLQQMADFGAYAVPFVQESLQEAFGTQVLCSRDFYSEPRLLVFIHDYGSLRAELEGSTHIHVDVERSYMLDATQTLINWAKEDRFGLLDVNVFPSKLKKGATEASLLKQLINYLWDNFIELADANDIVLIASGHTCRLLTDVLLNRPVDRKLKAVIQLVGPLEPARNLSSQPELQTWFVKHSLVVISEDHPKRNKTKFLNNCGTIATTTVERPTKILIEALPRMKQFVHEKLGLTETNGNHAMDVDEKD